MAISNAQVSVGTSATELVAAGNGGQVKLKNTGGTSVFVGDGSVTTSNGYEISANDELDIVIQRNESLSGIVATGTETIHVIRSGA